MRLRRRLLRMAAWSSMAGVSARAAKGKSMPHFSAITFTGAAAPPASPLTFWYRRPAERWLQALPLGNGRLGAMLFGAVDRERFQLNEKSLWSGVTLRESGNGLERTDDGTFRLETRRGRVSRVEAE